MDHSDIAVFFGNNAQSGGAIANNGNLQAGEETKLYLMKKTTTETNELFSFTVSLTREERGINGSFIYRDDETGALSRMYFDDEGKGNIKLRSGQKITILDLPAGTNFKIKEISLPKDWKLQSEIGSAGTISENVETVPAINAVFTNAKHNETNLPIGQHGSSEVQAETGDRSTITSYIILMLCSVIIFVITGLQRKMH